MKLLSISIAAYNAEKTLGKCIESMIKSDYIDKLEIFIVNDGSIDKTLAIAEKYSAMYPYSVFVINKENGGHGSTINSTVEKATAKYYKIVDSDDWLETENLDRLVELLETAEEDLIVNSYNSVDCCSGLVTVIPAFDSGYCYDKKYDICSIKKETFPAFFMHKLTIRTSIVKSMGPIIDEHCFYVDTEYVAFCLDKIKSVRFVNYPVYDYLQGDVNQSVSRDSRIKRVEEHKKVTDRLIKFYIEAKNSNSNNKDVLGKYIASVPIRNMYMTIFLLPLNKGKKQFLEFTASVPKELKTEIGKKMKILVFLLQIHNSILYYPVIGHLQKMGKIV